MADESPKPIRCKAAVCRAAGEPLTIEEIIVDPPTAYEMRIKIVCTSVCHTDIGVWSMKEDPALAILFPRIFGHEAFGVVESVGKHVEGFAEGDAVIPTFLGECGECSSCKLDQTNLCSKVPFSIAPRMYRDGTTRFRDAQGAPLYDFLSVSSFSQYIVVDMNQVVRVDSAMPPDLACLLSCGVSTGIGAAWRLAKVEPGSSVAIFGLGSVGLAVAEGATMCGASKIIGVDVNPAKNEIAKKFGVTHFINPKELNKNSPAEAIIEVTNGGADYCFECIGVSSLMTEAFRSAKQGGKTIILGLAKNNEPLSISSFELLFNKCIMGSIFGGIKPKTDIPILAAKCLNKELELEKFITHEVGFQDINKAFDLLLQGKSLRCMIWMDK